MNKQIFEILRKVVNDCGKPVPISAVNTDTDVSNRTFYNYWKEMCYYCDSLQIKDAIEYANGSFVFAKNKENASYIQSCMQLLSFSDYRLNSDERIALISAILAFTNFPVKNSFFEEMLCVSKNTITNDISLVKKNFEKKGINFDKNTHGGLVLNCFEEDRLDIILQVLVKTNSIKEYYQNYPSNPCASYLINYLGLKKYEAVSESIIHEIENEINGKVTDDVYYLLKVILSLFLSRYEKGYRIKRIYKDTLYNSEYFHFISCIRNKLKEHFNIDNNSIIFLIELFKKNEISFVYNVNRDDPKYVNAIIQNMLANVDSYYGIELENDTILMEYLNAHIVSCYHRIIAGKQIDNPYLEQIRLRYMNDFNNLHDNIYFLENGLNISLNDGEIAYILLHILASVERYRSNNKLPTIALVCNSGLATSNFLAEQLKNILKANIISLKSVHELSFSIKNEQIDLIISTVPLSYTDIRTIQVNAILTDHDYVHILKELENITYKKKKEVDKAIVSEHNVFKSLFDVKRVVLDVKVDTWQEAIIRVSEPLLWENMITPNYVHNMVDLVVKHGPYIVVAPGVAIPHASPNDGVIMPGISIMRLRKPVIFGKEGFDPVSIVICCAIIDEPEYINALMRLLTKIKDPLNIDRLLRAKTSEEIIKILKTE